MSDKLQLVIRYRTASGSDRPLVELTYEKRNELVATARGSVTINGNDKLKLIGQNIDRWSNVIKKTFTQ